MSADRTSEGPATWALIAGGGTAGHTGPALAVADALVAAGHDPASIHFVGSERGSEGVMVPAAGFTISLLPGRGIQRRLTAENIGAMWGLARAARLALKLVRARRPAVVLAVGGYASLACALAAQLCKVPVVVAEQNAIPGAANRLVAKRARACAVAFDGTGLPRAVFTGNPVLPDIRARAAGGRDAARTTARALLGIPDGRRLLLAFGGSLGARRINHAVYGLVGRWASRDDLTVHHVVGARDWDLDQPLLPEPPADGIGYNAVRYEDDMPTWLAAADVVISRAGATTVAELTVMGVPGILVPLPIASEDHQTANARALVGAGAALLVPDGELTVERLDAELDGLLSHQDTLAAMSASALALGRPDAAEAVAALLESAAGAPPAGGSGG